MQNNLFPVGFVGNERKPAYIKSEVINYLNTLVDIDVEEVYNRKWFSNETILIIDDEDCKFTQKQNKNELWYQNWITDINTYINY